MFSRGNVSEHCLRKTSCGSLNEGKSTEIMAAELVQQFNNFSKNIIALNWVNYFPNSQFALDFLAV